MHGLPSCMLTQGDGWILKGRTCYVKFDAHVRTWRMSSISCLVAQLTVNQMLEKSMPVFFSRPFLFQTVKLFTNSEPNACGGFLREWFLT